MAEKQDLSDTYLSVSSGILMEPLSEKGCVSSDTLRDTQLEGVITPYEDGNNGIQSLIDTSNGHGVHKVVTTTPAKEQNVSSDTRKAMNTVASRAPPSRQTSSTSPFDQLNHSSEEGVKEPVTVTEGEEHSCYTPSSSSDQSKRNDVFVSVKEHRDSIASITSELNTSEEQRRLAEEQCDDVTNEKNETFEAYKTAEDRNIQKIDELKSVTLESKDVREKLKGEKDAKRQLQRQMSEMEENLRKANEKIELLEKENQVLKEEKQALACQLAREKKEKESLQRKSNSRPRT